MATTAVTRPMGTLMNRTHRHESSAVSIPPRSTPTAPPAPPMALHSPRARASRRPGEGGDDDGQGGGGQGSAADALDGPGRGQPSGALGEPPDEAGPDEQEQAEQEDPAPPERVGRPPAEQEEAGEGEHVGVHHPLQADRGVVQVPPDRRQGDVHHRDVEDHHELGDAGQGQNHPVRGITPPQQALVASVWLLGHRSTSGQRSIGDPTDGPCRLFLTDGPCRLFLVAAVGSNGVPQLVRRSAPGRAQHP